METPIKIIAALTRDGAIGRSGDLLHHISADLKHFKTLTLGHPVIMGRRTFESLPGGPLPGRTNIVVTRNTSYSHPGLLIAPSLSEAIRLASAEHPEAIFIIGGGQIYAEALPLASTLELTRIETDAPDADTWFPEIDPAEWTVESQSAPTLDPRSGLTYLFQTLRRR